MADQIDQQSDSWKVWSKHVLTELDRLANSVSSLEQNVNQLTVTVKTELAMLKIKSGIWGLTGGVLTGIAAILIWLLSHYFSVPSSPR